MKQLKPIFLTKILHEKLLKNLPGSEYNLKINHISELCSNVSISRPTGKYVSKIFLLLVNSIFHKMNWIVAGHNAAPGFRFLKLDSQLGMDQFINWPLGCKLMAFNILGEERVKESVQVKAEPLMILELRKEWLSFSDYLNSMSTKYRTQAKRVLKASYDVELIECSSMPSSEWIPWAGVLLSKTLKKKTVSLPLDLEKLLAAYSKSLGNSFKIFGYKKNNSWIGFITFIVDEESVFAVHLGLEAKVSHETKLYQRCMLDLVKYSISANKRQLNLGRTATEIKSSIGALPVSNSYVFFSHSFFINIIFSFYAKYFHKLPSYKIRSPFKEKV